MELSAAAAFAEVLAAGLPVVVFSARSEVFCGTSGKEISTSANSSTREMSSKEAVLMSCFSVGSKVELSFNQRARTGSLTEIRLARFACEMPCFLRKDFSCRTIEFALYIRYAPILGVIKNIIKKQFKIVNNPLLFT
ncbi:MAG: hypothetical protein K6E38_07035 [Fretibacterium sp.]|nr:hypothetical protein [Fretibacterium sp.]